MADDTIEDAQTRRAQRARLREAQIAYIDALMKKTGLSRRALALAAGASSATLNRIMQEPDRLLSADTLHRLGDRHGLTFQPPDAIDMHTLAQGELPEGIAGEIRNLGPTIQTHRHKGRGMEGRGILDGDFAVIDSERQPTTGDVVLASFPPKPGRPPENALRLYIAPHLVGHPLDPAAIDELRPVVVDHVAARILGVVVGMLRWPSDFAA